MNVFPMPFARAVAVLAVTMMALPLSAQTVRPGGSARGTTGTGRAATTGRTGTSTSQAAGPRQYRSNTLLGDAVIQIDPETRSLVVVTDEETHGELLKVIKTLDQPKPQVLIKVVFVEVTYNKGSDIGVEGNYIFNQTSGNPAVTGASQTTVTTSGSTVDGGTQQVVTTNSGTSAAAAVAGELLSAGSNFGLGALTDGTFVRVLTDDWSATLRLLATRGKVEILSRPSIMARNNQEAVIVVGQEVPFITNSRTDALGQITNTIQYDNIGIILRVTPFITSDGTVEMIVAPEISSLTDRTVPISNTASAPVISKRSAETVVVTPNAQTIVIGGLVETQRIESVRKIPLLGDIPWLGAAFRRTTKDDVKRELLIFLTPYIVNTPRALKNLTQSELAASALVQRAFPPEELARYIDLPQPETIESQTDTKVTKVTEVRKATRVSAAQRKAPTSKKSTTTTK